MERERLELLELENAKPTNNEKCYTTLNSINEKTCVSLNEKAYVSINKLDLSEILDEEVWKPLANK